MQQGVQTDAKINVTSNNAGSCWSTILRPFARSLTSGTVMGNILLFFFFYDFPQSNFILGNRSHTKICFPIGNSHFHMGKIASVTAPNYEGSYPFELFKFHDFP